MIHNAASQGTPSWLLRLEQIQMQLKPEDQIKWLRTKGKEHGIPDEVIAAQLDRLGYVSPHQEKKDFIANNSVDTSAKPAKQGQRNKKEQHK